MRNTQLELAMGNSMGDSMGNSEFGLAMPLHHGDLRRKRSTLRHDVMQKLPSRVT
jgi:hypothetical protein